MKHHRKPLCITDTEPLDMSDNNSTSSTISEHVEVLAPSVNDNGNRPHRCQTCNKSFKYRSNLKRHVKTHSVEQSEDMSDDNSSSSTISEHVEVITPSMNDNANQPHRCQTCNRSFKYRSKLKRHIKTHSVEPLEDMNDDNSSSSIISEHVEVITPSVNVNDNRPHRCQTCNKSFKYRSNLKKHMKTHSLEPEDMSDENSSSSMISEHVEVTAPSVNDNDNRPHRCHACNKRFKYRSTLKRHMRTHFVELPCCEICNKSFSTNANLKTHMRTHTGERPYSCELCNKTFTVRGNLNSHMKIHTGERPYSCEICYKSFSVKANLKCHMKTHTGERPYSCQICHKTFPIEANIKPHMRTHTGERPYICAICNKSFTVNANLKVHMRTHTGERPYSCAVCQKSFSHSANLKKHVNTHSPCMNFVMVTVNT